MADSPTGQERTETATPRRRAKAREKGQVAKSTEVPSVVVLAVALGVLAAMGPRMAGITARFVRHVFDHAAETTVNADTITYLVRLAAGTMAALILPLAGIIAAAGVASNLAQTGIVLTLTPLAPRLNRVSPATGIKRIFSKRGLMELFKSLVKIAVVSGVAAWTLPRTAHSFTSLLGASSLSAYGVILRAMFHMGAAAAVALAILAIVDFFFQRFQYEDQLKMTRQEVKEEFKENEGDPAIKGKIRGVQREMSRRRMMSAVKEADVVVTNPVHYAVALKYDPARHAAPRVVAKGARLLAKRIRDLAREAGVPIVENPPLARALYRACDVGAEVPLSLYKAVAELLAFVYRRRERAAAGGVA